MRSTKDSARYAIPSLRSTKIVTDMLISSLSPHLESNRNPPFSCPTPSFSLQMSEKEKKDNMKKVNGIFEMRLKNKEGKESIWTIDLKKVRRPFPHSFRSYLQFFLS
jgi:hypothetical protein